MSFGYSASDAILLAQLAWKTVTNSRKACGGYGELTGQVSALHIVLKRLEKEVVGDEKKAGKRKPDGRGKNTDQDEIRVIGDGCNKVLGTLNKTLAKYNDLGDQAHGTKTRRLWLKVRFGNGEVADVGELRGKVVYYTSLMTLLLNMRASKSIGRVEQKMNNVGGALIGIKQVVNCIAARQISQGNHEASILST